MRTPIGIQSFSMLNEFKASFKETALQLHKVGFNTIELMGYDNGKIFGIEAQEVRQILEDVQIKPISLCTFTGKTNEQQKNNMTNNWELFLEDAIRLGVQYVSCIYLFPEERTSIDDYYRLTELMNRCGERAKEASLQLVYHHHDFEFRVLNGQIPYEKILQQTDINLVKMEIDFYWMKKGGYDVEKLLKSNPKRFPLWHLKDIGNDQRFIELGDGTIDWLKVFNLSEEGGLDYFFIEQDEFYELPPLESLKKSYNYLSNFLTENPSNN